MTDTTTDTPDTRTASFTDPRIDMGHWYNKIAHLNVPTPTTYSLPLEQQDDGPPQWDTDKAITIVENLGGEAFVRSGYSSAPLLEEGSHIHSPDEEEVELTLLELASSHAMGKLPLGDALWFREFLDIDFCPYADASLHPEIRVFIRNGTVTCHHPRLEGFDNTPGGDEFYDEALQYIEWGWENFVADYAETVSNAIDGNWAVDFVMTRDHDWYLTDMCIDALYRDDDRGDGGWGNIAYHPHECEYNLIHTVDDDIPTASPPDDTIDNS